MEDCTKLSSANDDGSEQHEERTSSEPDAIWRSSSSVKIPTDQSVDILAYTFANLGQYDENKPIWYPLIWLAVIGAGGIIFGTNPSSPAAELLHHLNITRTKFLITETTSLKVAAQVASSCDIPSQNIFVLAKCDQPVPSDRQAFIKLLNHGENDWLTFRADDDGVSSRIAAYCTTSGSTGLPKAAQIPHSYVVAQAEMVEHRLKSRPYQPSQLMCLPVFHTFAAPISLVQPLRLGITTYFLPRFDLVGFVEAVSTFDVTETAIVPPILTKLLQLPPEDDRLKSLRYVLCAGAPISAELQSKLYPFLHPEATIGQVWGATELGWVSMFAPGEKDESGSIGTLLPGIELKLVDDAKGFVNADLVPGEALIRSPSVCSGYLGNVEASTAAFDDEGFYRTGDWVHTKGDNLYIDGRIKDVMKVNGWQVSPSEIENILLQHPEVADIAVVGTISTNDEGLEVTRPRAYVVRKGKSSRNPQATKKDLQDFVASRLVSYKRLTGGVVFVDVIPRNPTGKVLRRFLPAVQSNGVANLTSYTCSPNAGQRE